MGELEALRQVDFNWVVHPDLVWDDELPDAPGLHGNICDDIIDAARNLKDTRPALGRLLLGPGGAGKTHLLAMLRRRASREGMTFVMADLTDVRDFFETLLLGFVVSLHQPDAQSNVELIASGVGRYDLTVAKTDISSEPFVEVDRVSETMLAADPSITAVYPRIQSIVEMAGNGEQANGWLIALDPAVDDVGLIDVVEGEYVLGDNGAAVLESTANAFGLKIGDSIDVAYSYPQPREEGRPETVGSSQQRTTTRFTVNAIVRQDGVADAGVRDGLIIDLADAQSWLGLQGRAERVIGLVDSRLYQSRDSEAAALSVRNVASNVQAALGEEYRYSLDKAVILDASAQAFLILQALINTYGLMALGVVGLLVHTLVMTNVQEQKREMAILRILGSRQSYLFILVIGEVAVIGAIGIGLGVVLGQLITSYAVVPFITYQMSLSGLTARLQPAVSLTAVLPAIISAIADFADQDDIGCFAQ